jgi:PAS domain S-box-containing protein
MTVVGFVTFHKSSRTLEEISGLQLVQVAESLSGMIQISLVKDLRTLITVASDPQVVRDTLAGEYGTTQRKLSELYQLLSSEFEGLALYDTTGVLRADGVDEARIGISISERNYFKAAKEGKTGVGPMVPSKVTGAPIFGLSAPILSLEGEFIGGVLGVVKAEYLMEFISSITLGKTGHLFMIDQEGTIIAHPEKETILKQNIFDKQELGILGEKMIGQQSEAVEYTYHGTECVAGICPVPLTGWSIGATQNKDEIMGLAYANRNFHLAVSVCFIILIIAAVLILSKTVSEPVQTTLDTLNHAVNQAAEALLIIGLDGNVRFANPAMAAIVDRPAAEIVGKPFQPGDEAVKSTGEIWTSLKDGSVWSGRFSGSRKDNAPYILDFTLSPILGTTGKLMCYLAVGRDITRELTMQEQLLQSQKMEAVGTLAGGIAHDFNNILSAIFGYTDLALHRLDDRDRQEAYLKEIFNSAKRAKDLVSHILTFSRKAEMGQKPIIPKYIIKDTLKLLRASLPVTIEIRERLNSTATIMGNATQIHQMIMNLCTNAGYAMEANGGTLNLVLDEFSVEEDMRHLYPDLKPGNHLRVEVSDSGVGIPPNILERIFDPFFTTKPTGEGTGLGLSVVHGIVKGLGGEVLVTSDIGKGSTFTILLPILGTQLTSFEKIQHEKLPGGTEKILLVDDEVPVIQSFRALMENLGYGVQAFDSSVSAWEAFSTSPDAFDIIVTDYTMPQMTGINFSEKIRTIRPKVPIILCSGYLSLKEKINRLQPIEFVRKPVTADELALVIRKMLDG